MSFPLNIEKIMEIAEKFFKCKNARFEVKRFRTRYGLRYIEYGLGFLKKIKIFSYMLKSILSVYELKLPEKPKIRDRWDYVLELQIYEKMVEMIKRAMMIRMSILTTLFLIGVFVEEVQPGLRWLLISFALLLLPIVLIFPALRGGCEFIEPSEWAIPILYPYYKVRIKRLKEHCNEI